MSQAQIRMALGNLQPLTCSNRGRNDVGRRDRDALAQGRFKSGKIYEIASTANS
jgi:hypothetical protein